MFSLPTDTAYSVRELGALDLQLAKQVVDFNDFGEGILHPLHMYSLPL